TLRESTVERVAEAKDELINVASARIAEQIRVRLERLAHELPVRKGQSVCRASLRVDARIRENLGSFGLRRRHHQPLAHTPVVIEQVSEIREVDAELPCVSFAADVVEHVLNDAEVHAFG